MTILVPEFWTRSASFRRAHRIDVYEKATLILRDLQPGSWVIEGIPALIDGEPYAPYADLEEGGGIIAYYGGGSTRGVLFAGRLEELDEVEEIDEDGAAQVSKKVGGPDDKQYYYDRLGHPHPADLDFAAAAVKLYASVGETAVKALINDNLGSTANSTRKLANFATATDMARGATIRDEVRLDGVGMLVEGWCIRSGILPQCLPASGVLTFDVYVGTTRDEIVFTTRRNNATRIRRRMTAPTVTFEWVGGQGIGAARTFRNAEDSGQSSVWDFRREAFKDRRDTADTTVLDQQGAEDIDAGASNTMVEVDPVEGQWEYGEDYELGDLVSVLTRGGILVQKAIRQVTVECSPQVITRFSPSIGDPLTPGVDDLYVFKRVRNLEVDTNDGFAGT